jgi:hypothetical protein
LRRGSPSQAGSFARWLSWITATLLATSSFGASPRTGETRTVNFAWKPPAGSSDQPIVSYKIYWGTGSGNYQHAHELKPIAKTSLELGRHITYYVAVRASNMFGESALSNEVIVSAEGTVTAVALLDSRPSSRK